jgi:hypothetical protein
MGNIKMVLKEIGWDAWTGLVWLETRIIGELL